MWVATLGSAPGGRTGHLVTEILRNLVFDFTLKLQESELTAESMPAVAEQVKSLSLTAQQLERASDISENRERRIREDERRQALEAGAEVAERSVVSQGLSAAIKREILGVPG